MNKRGQIFLVASLIIVLALIGVVTVYNSAYVVHTDSKIANTAKEIKYEGLRVMDYGAANELSFEETGLLLNQLIAKYSTLNPDITIIAWFYYPLESKEMNFTYILGKSAPIPDSLKINRASESAMEVTWNDAHRNIYYNLSINTNAYNFNVLVMKEDNDERNIAAE